MNQLLEFVFQTLLQEVVIVIFGVLFALFIKSRWDEWRYGGWRVIISRGGEVLLEKAISPGKARHILEVPEDKLVFLKGLVSPFETLNCDLVEDGPRLGLYVEDTKAKKLLIKLENNPLAKDKLAEVRR